MASLSRAGARPILEKPSSIPRSKMACLSTHGSVTAPGYNSGTVDSLDNVIATLNNLEMGCIDTIDAQLGAARAALRDRELSDLVEKLDECRLALARGDLHEFRRLRETIVSQLGHLRQRWRDSSPSKL